MGGRVGFDPKFGEDSAGVGLHCAHGYKEVLGDAVIGMARGEEAEHLALLTRELGQRVHTSWGGEYGANNGGVDDRPALDDPAQGVNELGRSRNAFFQQVADAAVTGSEKVDGVAGLDMLRQDEDANFRGRAV